jgi:glycosyltransferase involved in cell wall biosynthesis
VDGVTGFLVPPADAGALSRALQALCADASLRQTMGQRGLERAIAHYRSEDVTARTLRELILG